MRVAVIGEDSNLARALVDRMDQVMTEDVEWLNCYHTQSLAKTYYRKMHFGAWVEEFDILADFTGTFSNAAARLADKGPELIINAAGLVNSLECHKRELSALRANYETAAMVRRLATYTGARVLNLATTASYVSPGEINEQTEPSLRQTAYSMTKLLGEQDILTLPADQVLNVRVMFVYGGVRDRSSMISKLVHRDIQRRRGIDVMPLRQNLDIHARRAVLHVEDFAEAVVELLRQGCLGTYVVGNPREHVPYTSVISRLNEVGVVEDGVSWMTADDPLGQVGRRSPLRNTAGEIGGGVESQFPVTSGDPHPGEEQ